MCGVWLAYQLELVDNAWRVTGGVGLTLFLVDQRMPELEGTELLVRATPLFPQAPPGGEPSPCVPK